VADKHINEADYYHARAADMMAKAQTAPSKAIRVAYLNLARIWARKAAALDAEWQKSHPLGHGEAPGSVAAGPKN
jgi:hypothetical protein